LIALTGNIVDIVIALIGNLVDIVTAMAGNFVVFTGNERRTGEPASASRTRQRIRIAQVKPSKLARFKYLQNILLLKETA
jgi:hypothetical protein